MPTLPLKPCSHPGCKNITRGKRCDVHTKAYNKQADDRRGSAAYRGYDRRWQRIAAFKLAQAPLCERCESIGKVVAAVLVHHRDHDSHNNDPCNHESLCNACHAREHSTERWGRGG